MHNGDKRYSRKGNDAEGDEDAALGDGGANGLEELTPLYTVSQVADYLGVHPHTIYRYLQEGRIKAVRIGSTYRFTAHDINEYVAECSIDNS